MNQRQLGAIFIMFGGVAVVVGGTLSLLASSPAVEATALVATPTTSTLAEPPASQPTTSTEATTTSSLSTSSTSTSTTIDIETPEEFLILLVQGLREDPDLLVSRLNQATLDIYGAAQCRETLGQTLDPETELELREIGDTGPWDYLIDDITTRLDDVLSLEVQRVVAGQTLIQELHWQLVQGQWTWFSDCGDPLPR